MDKKILAKLKNPVSKKTKIEGIVPRRQLPDPPRGYDWFLQKRVSYRTHTRIVKKSIKKYRYILSPVKVERYHYIKIPVRVKLYRYIKVKGKRKRKYFLATGYKRKRRYYIDTVYKKKRHYYTVTAPVKVKVRRKYTVKWWILKKKVKPPVKEEWIDTSTYLKTRYKKLKLTTDDVEVEKYPPFDWIEKNVQFNFYIKKLPTYRVYDLIFIYYIIQVPLYEVGKKTFRYVLVSSSFDLVDSYTLMQIVKKFVPLAIKTLKTKMKKSKKSIRFLDFICFSAVKKHELEKGK